MQVTNLFVSMDKAACIVLVYFYFVSLLSPLYPFALCQSICRHYAPHVVLLMRLFVCVSSLVCSFVRLNSIMFTFIRIEVSLASRLHVLSRACVASFICVGKVCIISI